MKVSGILLILGVLMKPVGASSSAPAQFLGPDSSERYVGVVQSAAKSSQTVGTSDVSADTREFLEIQLKVQSHVTLEFPLESLDASPVPKKPDEKVLPPKLKEIAHNVSPEKTVRFFFKPDEKIKVGDHLEVTTRSRRSISYGWVSGEHGATYRILKKDAK